MGKRKLEEAKAKDKVDAQTVSGSFGDEVEGEPKAVKNGENNSENSEDDDEDDGDDDEEEEEDKTPKHSHPPSKKQKKALSAQEVQVARETAELFKSNIFKLQIDELVKEVKLKDSHVTKIEKVLHRLHDFINKVPPIENLTLQQAENHFNSKKLVIPFPDPKPTKVNYTFSYLAPEDVSLVGSFGLKTGISQADGMSIDIALTMPSELFQPKDYLNYRALYKRAFYLAYVADNLIPLSKKTIYPLRSPTNF